ncbi:MAG: 2,3-diketo-L-gulonate TRAP transporter small permease protein YiaM [Desulfovibrio sp.]
MKILKWLDAHLEETLIFTTLSAMSIIIALQVLMRYGFQASLSWSEEIARYLFIWLIYIGISYGVKKNAHVAVTALDMVVSSKGRYFLKVLSSVIFLIFSAIIVYYSWQVCAKIMRLGQEAPGTGLEMWLVYLAAPTGFALAGFRLLQRLYLMHKNPESI